MHLEVRTRTDSKQLTHISMCKDNAKTAYVSEGIDMEPKFFHKDVVIVGNSVGIIVGHHYAIDDLYVVELCRDGNLTVEYVRESAITATR
jgi:hypothetical protein